MYLLLKKISQVSVKQRASQEDAQTPKSGLLIQGGGFDVKISANIQTKCLSITGNSGPGGLWTQRPAGHCRKWDWDPTRWFWVKTWILGWGRGTESSEGSLRPPCVRETEPAGCVRTGSNRQVMHQHLSITSVYIHSHLCTYLSFKIYCQELAQMIVWVWRVWNWVGGLAGWKLKEALQFKAKGCLFQKSLFFRGRSGFVLSRTSTG